MLTLRMYVTMQFSVHTARKNEAKRLPRVISVYIDEER